MRTYIYSFLLFALTSCSQTAREIDCFDVVQEIADYDSLYSDKDNPLGMITDMNIRNNVLVTSHLLVSECKYSFVDAASGKLLARWGKTGNGPGEFLDFGNGFILNDSLLVFLDRMQKNINYVSYPSILKGGDTVLILSESYPYEVDFRPLQLCLVGSYKVFAGAYKDGLFGVIDSHDSILSHSLDYPFPVEPLEGIFRGSSYQSKIKSCAGTNKFVMQFLSSDVFEIFQIDSTGISRVATSTFQNPPAITKRNGRYGIDYSNSIAGLMHMAVSEKFIYFLYSSENASNTKSSNEILCFNWDGEQVKKYILPFPIDIFCTDDVYIYGACEYENETVVYRFAVW